MGRSVLDVFIGRVDSAGATVGHLIVLQHLILVVLEYLDVVVGV